MYPGKYAREFPEKAAAIHSITGETVTYQQLDENSNRLSQFLYDSGLRRGDHISIFMDNNLKYFEIAWAALRSGLYLTTINRYLTAPEVSYIVQDSMSKCLVTTSVLSEVAENLITESEFADCTLRLMCEGTIAGWDSYEDTLNSASPKPLTDQWLGSTMLYSSGTTGKPKGILRPLPPIRITDFDDDIPILGAYGFGLDTVYLSPAPLYHAAPFAFTNQVHRLGGTNVVMPRFDALEALRCIEEFSITHSQWVPTMFVRMLKLTDAERFRYDLASHKVAIHAAAPCPVDVKRRMIEWWGPI
ncbi:MAG: AMP-binding protein, partial [Gammaproteobacteria bacterium]|nr:AMP-binding protein [Gammaproteobacteria bacterium]